MTLAELLEKARARPMSAEELEKQRISFAYGNASLENDRITRDTVVRESEKLRGSQNGEGAAKPA